MTILSRQLTRRNKREYGHRQSTCHVQSGELDNAQAATELSRASLSAVCWSMPRARV